MCEIKTGYCVAYDWELLKISLPLVYSYADKICLSLDRNRKSWAGNPFPFDDEAFFRFVKETDRDKKILVYEDDFSMLEEPMKNEVYQRNKMASFLGKDTGWHIQLDADEYPADMESFTSFLKNHYSRFRREVNISLPWLTLYKKVDEGFLAVKGKTEWIQVATNKPFYQYGRRNGYFNYKADFLLLHQSWARQDSEILDKVNNWGHKNDYDAVGYYHFWKQISSRNYQEIRNFHPNVPRLWEKLELIKAKSIPEVLMQKELLQSFRNYSKASLTLDNSRFIAKMKQLFSSFARQSSSN